jgi:hypothetical protein
VEEFNSLNDFRRIAHEQGILTVKTHQRLAEVEEVDAIVIVRDARRVFSSLKAFYWQRLGSKYSMEQVILGETVWGDWSAWVRSWMGLCSSGSLWLRYEDIMRDRKTAVDRIAAWCGVKPKGYDIPDFEELHKGDPTIFRAAENSGNGGMTEEEENLFWKRHGTVMSILGYHRDGS